jgi:wobble nucleotide-excising tRNase
MARERSIAIMKRFMRKFERACDLEEKNHPEMSKSSLKEHMEGFSLRKLVEMINEKNARALDNAAQIHGLEPVLYVLAKR